ncbi:hypothetical protein TL16_g07251 [Triparma laevis f. inornata]|uniref:Uncharacterized protein n=1 Tax=Triparma laevis f. inornata TaxID=1714386 RepID=A0A9W7EGD1_9STRA|nr:hypothetical protein TL16_g07251 [Triparma laevis f. inornata]
MKISCMRSYISLITLFTVIMLARGFSSAFLKPRTFRLLDPPLFSTASASASASSPISSLGSKVSGSIVTSQSSSSGTLFTLNCSDLTVDSTANLLGTTLKSDDLTASCYMIRYPLIHLYTDSTSEPPTNWEAEVEGIWKDEGNKVQDIHPIKSQFITGDSLIDITSSIGHGQNMLFINIPDELKSKITAKSISVMVPPEDDEDIVKTVRSYVEGMSRIVELSNQAIENNEDLVVYVNSVSILNRITEYSDSIIREKYGEKGISESESRAFYSDVVQRSGKFSEGSLTVLLELQDDVSLDEYDPSGFNEKDAARLSVLKDKGVKITDRILEKLSINRPGNWGEEFISLSDGQVVWNGQGIIDVKKSNTRVGVGTGLEKSRAMCEEFVEVGGNGVRVRILQEIDGVEGERGILDAMRGRGSGGDEV